jgi:SAM-dependent methyltransferase
VVEAAGERRSGFLAVLRNPRIYNIAQRCIGTTRSRDTLINTYVQPGVGARVLDIGCGTASILEHLDSASYTGFDPSPAYAEAARARYGDRGRFFVGRIGEISASDLGSFDVVLAKGVLHHVDDQLAKELFALAAGVLEPRGRLVTFDGCYAPGQARVARFLLSHDRGRNVRTAGEYETLARSAFDDVAVHVRHDLVRFPYTHAILVCSADGESSAQ